MFKLRNTNLTNEEFIEIKSDLLSEIQKNFPDIWAITITGSIAGTKYLAYDGVPPDITTQIYTRKQLDDWKATVLNRTCRFDRYISFEGRKLEAAVVRDDVKDFIESRVKHYNTIASDESFQDLLDDIELIFWDVQLICGDQKKERNK